MTCPFGYDVFTSTSDGKEVVDVAMQHEVWMQRQ